MVRALSGKRVLGAGSKVVFSSGGVTSVAVKLNRTAKRILAYSGELRLRLEVSLGEETQIANVNLRRAK
jgi:hypothetical protein